MAVPQLARRFGAGAGSAGGVNAAGAAAAAGAAMAYAFGSTGGGAIPMVVRVRSLLNTYRLKKCIPPSTSSTRPILRDSASIDSPALVSDCVVLRASVTYPR